MIYLIYSHGRCRVVLVLGDDRPKIYFSSKYRGKSLIQAIKLRDSLNLPLEYRGLQP